MLLLGEVPGLLPPLGCQSLFLPMCAGWLPCGGDAVVLVDGFDCCGKVLVKRSELQPLSMLVLLLTIEDLCWRSADFVKSSVTSACV